MIVLNGQSWGVPGSSAGQRSNNLRDVSATDMAQLRSKPAV
jgi:hypothetical protein